MEYKAYNFNSFNLYTIKTDKFKNCHMEIIFRNKILREEIMARKFLIEMMCYTTLNYPTQKELSIHLEDLYNASFYGLLSRVGASLFTTFCFDFLNPKYCEKGYLENILSLIPEVILNPNIHDDEFDSSTFKIIKNNIINEIKSSKENIRSYAYRSLFKAMDKESFLAIDMVGTKTDAENMTSKKVVDIYQKMIDEDCCDIYLIGNLDMDKIASKLEKVFLLRSIKDYDLPLFYPINGRSKIQVKKEYKDLSQANLLVGCNIVNIDDTQKDIIGYIYNFILGGGSLDTKLGNYLRQDNSLCYTVNSIYQKYDSAIIIYSGIDASNYDKAVRLIKKALKEMTIDISQEELENAKKSLITSLNMIYDNPSNLINNYLFRNIADLKTVDERIKLIENIELDDIKKFAKKVKINTIYLLGGDK